MRNLWLVCLLSGSLAWSQAGPGAHKPENTRTAPPPVSAVPLDAPVLTIKGLCPTQPAAGQTCQTVITREQFEKLIAAIEPNMDDESKHEFTLAYPRILMLAQVAVQRGIDKTPRFEERLNFARVQILSQELTRQIQLQAAEVPDADIQDYYQKNSKNFETVTVERVVVPIRAAKAEASEEALSKEADSLRARAAAGEDFVKLQKEAYDLAGMSGNTSPAPKMSDMRRRSFPLTQAAVFDLKPGEVSAVITDGTGHYIYKMDSKGMAPLDSVKQEIWTFLRRERARTMIESVEQPFTSDVNQTYFGATESKGKE